MSVGERLRRARLDAGLTLFRINEGTKIPFWILESIERDDFSRIPGGIFIRGYLDAFARAVRLDPHEILTAHFGERPTPVVTDFEWQPTGTPLWQTAIIAVAIITLGVMWANAARSNSDARPGPASRAAPVAQPKPPAPQPKAAVPTAVPTVTRSAVLQAEAVDAHDVQLPAVATAGSQLVVEVHTTGEVWIDATADGERKAYRLFMSGEMLRLEAQSEVRMTIGDAAAVTCTINGQPSGALGARGVVRELVIPATGYQALLATGTE